LLFVRLLENVGNANAVAERIASPRHLDVTTSSCCKPLLKLSSSSAARSPAGTCLRNKVCSPQRANRFAVAAKWMVLGCGSCQLLGGKDVGRNLLGVGAFEDLSRCFSVLVCSVRHKKKFSCCDRGLVLESFITWYAE